MILLNVTYDKVQVHLQKLTTCGCNECNRNKEDMRYEMLSKLSKKWLPIRPSVRPSVRQGSENGKNRIANQNRATGGNNIILSLKAFFGESI